MDFFFLNRLIDVGGIIVIDDTGIPAINKMMRYVLNYPCYKQIGSVGFKPTAKRELLDAVVKTPFRLISSLLPHRLKYEIFSGSLIRSNKKLNLNASMIALQKVAEDDRNWDWYKEF